MLHAPLRAKKHPPTGSHDAREGGEGLLSVCGY